MGKSDRSGRSQAERHNKHTSEVRREVVDVCGQHSQSTEIHKSRKRQRTIEIHEERLEEEKNHEKGKKKHKKEKKKQKKSVECGLEPSPSSFGPMPPENQTLSESNDLTVERRMAPMTKEQWEQQRSTIRRVYDPETGRNRLMRGSGEILEEIVSKKRHKELNKRATTGDGIFYQYKAGLVNK